MGLSRHDNELPQQPSRTLKLLSQNRPGPTHLFTGSCPSCPRLCHPQAKKHQLHPCAFRSYMPFSDEVSEKSCSTCSFSWYLQFPFVFISIDCATLLSAALAPKVGGTTFWGGVSQGALKRQQGGSGVLRQAPLTVLLTYLWFTRVWHQDDKRHFEFLLLYSTEIWWKLFELSVNMPPEC